MISWSIKIILCLQKFSSSMTWQCGPKDTGDSDTDTDTDSDSEASDDEEIGIPERGEKNIWKLGGFDVKDEYHLISIFHPNFWWTSSTWQDLGEKLKDFDKSTSTVAAKDDKLRTTTRCGLGQKTSATAWCYPEHSLEIRQESPNPRRHGQVLVEPGREFSLLRSQIQARSVVSTESTELCHWQVHASRSSGSLEGWEAELQFLGRWTWRDEMKNRFCGCFYDAF